MSMRRGNDIRTGLVDFRVNHESSLVDGQLGTSFSDISITVHQDQIGGLDGGKVLGKGVHPKVVFQNRV